MIILVIVGKGLPMHLIPLAAMLSELRYRVATIRHSPFLANDHSCTWTNSHAITPPNKNNQQPEKQTVSA
jgi:hypothetical protein